MRALARQILRRSGYELHRFLPTTSPDAQLARVLETFAIDLVLDVGANIGQYGRLLRSLGYRGGIVSFEPLAAAHAGLSAAAAHDPGWTAAPRGAIGARPGTLAINIAGNSASSSLLDMLDTHRAAATESAYVGTESVEVSRLDDAAAPFIGDARRIMVKVDTQGYEQQVLDGGPQTIAAAVAVQLELSLAPLYAGQPDFAAMIAAITARGFALWAIWPGFADPGSGRILQADAIFARPGDANG
jgi:FkbM family methyltransferase